MMSPLKVQVVYFTYTPVVSHEVDLFDCDNTK